jgi:hypothetical protein
MTVDEEIALFRSIHGQARRADWRRDIALAWLVGRLALVDDDEAIPEWSRMAQAMNDDPERWRAGRATMFRALRR